MNVLNLQRDAIIIANMEEKEQLDLEGERKID